MATSICRCGSSLLRALPKGWGLRKTAINKSQFKHMMTAMNVQNNTTCLHVKSNYMHLSQLFCHNYCTEEKQRTGSGASHSVMRRLTEIENSMRFYGYSTIRIGFFLVVITGKSLQVTQISQFFHTHPLQAVY